MQYMKSLSNSVLRQAQHSFSFKLMTSYAVHTEPVEGAGDVPITFADTTPLEEDFGFRPATPLRDGLIAFAEWFAKYYGVSE